MPARKTSRAPTTVPAMVATVVGWAGRRRPASWFGHGGRTEGPLRRLSFLMRVAGRYSIVQVVAWPEMDAQPGRAARVGAAAIELRMGDLCWSVSVDARWPGCVSYHGLDGESMPAEVVDALVWVARVGRLLVREVSPLLPRQKAGQP